MRLAISSEARRRNSVGIKRFGSCSDNWVDNAIRIVQQSCVQSGIVYTVN